MQRIFIGIKVPKEIQEAVALWRIQHTHMPVRWIRDHDLHVTIIPPWNEINVHGVLRKIRIALQGRKQFTIELHKITLAPDPRKPRLIWAEGYPEDKLQSLKMALHKQVNHTDDRPLRPHVTLARFNRQLFQKMGVKNLLVPIKWHLTVDSIILYESTQGVGKGYKIIEEFKIGQHEISRV